MYSVGIIRSSLSTAFVLTVLLIPHRVWAACDKSDPCAPQKKLDSWNKSLALGFNLTDGNSNTLLATAIGQINREEAENIYDLSVSVSYGEDKAAEDESGDSTTRNDNRASASYKRLLTERFFAAMGTSYLYDDIAAIDYRVTLAPALGYFLLKNDDFKLSAEAGPGYVFEDVGDEKNDYFAPRIAERFDWIISCTSKLFQTTELILDTTDSENYLVNSEIGIEAAVSSSIALVLSVKDNYDAVPAIDREKNDVVVVSALKFAL